MVKSFNPQPVTRDPRLVSIYSLINLSTNSKRSEDKMEKWLSGISIVIVGMLIVFTSLFLLVLIMRLLARFSTKKVTRYPGREREVVVALSAALIALEAPESEVHYKPSRWARRKREEQMRARSQTTSPRLQASNYNKRIRE